MYPHFKNPFDKGLSSEIHEDLNLTGNPLSSLEGLRGKRIGGSLHLRGVSVTSIPPRIGGGVSADSGLELGGTVILNRTQTALKQDALRQGYSVDEF